MTHSETTPRLRATLGWGGLLTLAVVVLLGIGFSTNGPATGQGDPTTPPRVYEPAITAIQNAIPGIGRPDGWRHEIIANAEVRGLGCPTASTDALPAPVGVWRVWLNYGGTEYLYYVSDDGSLVQPCDPKLPGTPSAGGDGSSRLNSECRVEATLANVRSFPDTTADNVITQLENGAATAIGRTGDSAWFQVQLANGQIGWIAESASEGVGNCADLPITGNTTIEFGPCPPGFSPSYLPPRIGVGDVAAIESGGDPNVVRAQPQRSGERLGLLQPGTEINVLEGPQCGAGFVWWRVSDGTLTGWTVESSTEAGEYFIRLVSSAAAPTQAPPSNSNPGAGTGTGTATGTTPGASAEPNALPAAPSGTTQLLNANNLGRVQPLAALPAVNAATAITFSPDGNYLAVLNDGDALLYSLPGYTAMQSLNGSMRSAEGVNATAIAFDAASQYLVIGFDTGFVFLADLGRDIVFRIDIEAGAPLQDIAFSTNNRMALVSGGPEAVNTAAVYDLARLDAATGDVPTLFTLFYDDPVLAAAFANDDTLTVATADTLEAHNVVTGEQGLEQTLDLAADVRPVIVPANGFAGVNGVFSVTTIINNEAIVAYSPGDTFAGTLNTVPLARVDALQPLAGPPAALVVAGALADGTPTLLVLDDTTVSVVTTAVIAASDLALAPDGRLLLTVSDGQVVFRGVR